MGERGHFNENEGQRQNPLADASAWTIDNAIRPFLETLSEPYNSFVAPAVESVAKSVFGSDSNLHIDLGRASEPEMLSAGWAASNVSKAIALTGIYAVAERIASKPLRLAGLGVHCLGDMAKARLSPLATMITKGLEKGLLSKSTSLVVGASSYDGLRNERPGETHAGNFWGTAAGFTMFEAGNKYAKLSGSSLANIASYGLKRAAVGVAGGMSQVGISKAIAGGETSSAELAGSALIGGTINTLFGLPAVGRQLKFNAKTAPELESIAKREVEAGLSEEGLPLDNHTQLPYPGYRSFKLIKNTENLASQTTGHMPHSEQGLFSAKIKRLDNDNLIYLNRRAATFDCKETRMITEEDIAKFGQAKQEEIRKEMELLIKSGRPKEFLDLWPDGSVTYNSQAHQDAILLGLSE